MSQSAAPAGLGRATNRGGRRTKGTGPQTYDFRRPTKLSREQARTLQIAYETFARQYTTLLTSSLRVVSQVVFTGIEQQSYDEYISSLANPTILGLMTLEPLPGTALIEVPLDTAHASIDHMLGGPGGEQPQRQLSEIENVLLRGLLDRVLGEFRYSFEQIKSVTPKLGAFEYNPQFVQVAAPADPMVVASFDIRVGSLDRTATLCLPFGAVVRALKRQNDGVALSPAERQARLTARRGLTSGLEQAPVPVVVRFQSTRMHAGDIVALRPGDVITLNHPVNHPLTLSTAGIPIVHAVPGNQGARLACLVVESPPQEDHR